MSTTTAFDITTLIKALNKASLFIKQTLQDEGFKQTNELVWQPRQGIPGYENQRFLMQRFEAVKAELENFGELKAWASRTAKELNKILADHGFNIRLEPWADDGRKFGVVAIYDLTIKWLVIGDVKNKSGSPYLVEQKPAFRLGATDAQIIFFTIPGSLGPIIRIPGQNAGDSICITKSDPLADFALLQKVEELQKAMRNTTPNNSWGGVIMPNIIFDQKIDISWLKGLFLIDGRDDEWLIEQARMEIKFAMGPEGARAKVAVATQVFRRSLDSPKPDYVVNHDFILWMQRGSITSEPLFSSFMPVSEFADHTVSLNEID